MSANSSALHQIKDEWVWLHGDEIKAAAAQKFDAAIAEVQRKAAEEALLAAAQKIEGYAAITDRRFTEHAVAETEVSDRSANTRPSADRRQRAMSEHLDVGALKRVAEKASVQRLKDSIQEWRDAVGRSSEAMPLDGQLEFWHAGYKHGALAMIDHQAALLDRVTQAEDHALHSGQAYLEATGRAEIAEASITRVRAVHQPAQKNTVSSGTLVICDGCGGSYPCTTIDALDARSEASE